MGVVAPVLRRVAVDPGPIDWANAKAIAVTSTFAAHRLPDLPFVPTSLPVFTTGDQTQKAVTTAGFQDVTSANGDAGDLVDLLARRLAPGSVVIYPCAAQTARDIGLMATERGLDVRPVCVYRSEVESGFPTDVQQALVAGDVDGVLLFSARGAAGFVALLDHYGLGHAMRDLAAVCMSQAIADRLSSAAGDRGWKAVLASDRPNLASMLALVPAFGDALSRPLSQAG